MNIKFPSTVENTPEETDCR